MIEREPQARIEALLVELGEELAWPGERDLGTVIRARLERGAPSRPAARRAWLRPALAVGIAVLAFSTAGAFLFPEARQAVADWLGISGIEIRVDDGSPAPTSDPALAFALQLGEEISLAQAESFVDFDVATPDRSTVTPRVFFSESPGEGAVSLVYPPGRDLPETSQTGVGLLLTQFEARLDEVLIRKVSTVGTRVSPVELGDRAYWIEGKPHTLLYLGPDGEVLHDRVRFADNTLVWEENGVSYRLESALDLDVALALARSVE